MTDELNERKYSDDEAEHALGLRRGHLSVLRGRGKGPAYYKNERRVVYGESALRAWLSANARMTSDCGINSESKS